MGLDVGNLISHGLAQIISAYGFAQDLTAQEGSSAAKRLEDKNVLITVQFADPEGRYAIGRIRNEPKLVNLTFGLWGPRTLLVEMEPRDADAEHEPDEPVLSKSKVHEVPRHIRQLELKFMDASGAVLKSETVSIHA